MVTNGPTLAVLAAGRARRYGGCKPLAPIGPSGEAVLDLLASDAAAAGFTRLVLVVGPSTGAAIRYHVEHTWPATLDVHFAVQETPLGTVGAVLVAAGRMGGQPFAVANADDLYGPEPLRLAADHVAAMAAGAERDSALVAFRLRAAVIGRSPVTRGVVRVDAGGRLAGIDERRLVEPLGDDRFAVKDGREPSELDGDTLVSMNLFAFSPAVIGGFETAMARAHATEESELLLPEVVSSLAAGGDDRSAFVVRPTGGRCIGVTHPGDLELVQTDVKRQVALGERPAAGFTGA